MSENIMEMTHEERLEYWKRKEEEERKKRQVGIDGLLEEQIDAIKEVRQYATEIVEEALHGCGVRYIKCDDINQLEDALGKLNNYFNFSWSNNND